MIGQTARLKPGAGDTLSDIYGVLEDIRLNTERSANAQEALLELARESEAEVEVETVWGLDALITELGTEWRIAREGEVYRVSIDRPGGDSCVSHDLRYALRRALELSATDQSEV